MKKIKLLPIHGHRYASGKRYFLVDDDNNQIMCYGLKSYNTYIIRIENNRMVVTGLYSATTRKHISWFLASLPHHIRYDVVKKAVGSHMAIELDTGDLVDLTKEESVFITNCRHSAPFIM